jgi:GDP-L-fucose synthase
MVAESAGFKGETLWDTSKPDGTPQKLLDVAALFSLGWKPRIFLDAGITETINEFDRSIS